MIKFDCKVKVRPMQEDDKLSMWVGSWISWFKPLLLPIVSILELSGEVISASNQLLQGLRKTIDFEGEI